MSSPLKLDWCSHEAAKYAVEKWHYSRSLPTPPIVRVGVWEDGRFTGCVLFSRGAAQNIGKPFGLEQTEIAELTRIALAQHQAPVSRIASIAIRLLRRQCPGLRLLVSFADPSHGHAGAIYQAGNWLYLGQGAETVEFIAPDGKQWHGRMISPTGRKKVYGSYRPVWKPAECTSVRCVGKHKYALPLDAAMRAQILRLARPYPKKPGATSIVADALVDQTREGGPTPTVALPT